MPNMKKVRVRCKFCGKFRIRISTPNEKQALDWKCDKCKRDNLVIVHEDGKIENISDKIIENTQLKC